MSRTKAEALVLVNWKGVFYERYLLDRHVTALEGANGAGKTTVMIAAYMVLLPDMSRLRFTNLGETGATGGDRGVAGRLGESGRPSYAVLDFALPGKNRLVAGVHLVRKGETAVEPTPFIVAGLAGDVRLQELLLVTQGDSDVVPELPELRENAARLGGRLTSFQSVREYFAALFDQGVMPMRLGTDEERNKLNEMLRTSMTGGISRALTSELRAFLLKEEGGLADTLQRMRANLDACRRTRTEVQQSRQLEREIGGVFDAGHTMFVAAYLATRERAEELTRRAEESAIARDRAAETQRNAKEALASTLAELHALDGRAGELGQHARAAREWREKLHEALRAIEEVTRSERALAEADTGADVAAQMRAAAVANRARSREALRRAQEGYRRASRGRAELQSGIEELHRRAGAFAQASRRLQEAKRCLGIVGTSSEDYDRRLESSRAELVAIDAERRDALTRLADAESHRTRFAEVMGSLTALVGTDIGPAGANDLALDALVRYRQAVVLAERLPAIEVELAEAEHIATRQSRARAQAAALEIRLDGRSVGETVARLLEEVDAASREHEDLARSAEAECVDRERELRELGARRQGLEERAPVWRAHVERAARLADHLGCAVDTRETLDTARTELADKLGLARRTEGDRRAQLERLQRDERELMAAGGPFPVELLRLRDELGADLIAGSFDDLGIAEAARVEARLGALVQALVVDDPTSIAASLAQRSEAMPDVLLVSREVDLEGLAATPDAVPCGPGDVAVDDGMAVRISRLPSHPRLGRRARAARAAELRAEAERIERVLQGDLAAVRRLERLVADGEELLAGRDLWLTGDPAPDLAETVRSIAAAEERRATSQAAAGRHHDSARALLPRVTGLRTLLGEASLLDPPDHSERARLLDAERNSARAAKVTVARSRRHADVVDRNLPTLRQVPLSDGEVVSLQERLRSLTATRERLDAGIDALTYVRTNAEALGWAWAQRRLSDEEALLPALDSQLAEAELAQRDAEAAATLAEHGYDDATVRFQDADGMRRVAQQELAAAAERLKRTGVPEPTVDALTAAGAELERLERALREQGERRDALLIAKGAGEGSLREADARLRTADDELASNRREAEPAVRRWDAVQARAAGEQLLGAIAGDGGAELAGVRGHVNFLHEATTRRRILFERLQGAQGGPELLAGLKLIQEGTDAAFADAQVDLWLAVRDWLRRRLPAQVAEVDDPREALERLRDQLSGLEERLSRQEGDLRGASEDVARGIDVQIRKARGQVVRLNKNLEGVAFGSIRGIRVRLQHVDRMEQVLRALRTGEAQALLFQADLPIDEALNEIFSRHGGGRTGGQKLLDYREYVHLQVEIRRKAGTDWEIANPTRLSTGEAIGVGAALMMVVLTEWERDATLLRGKKSHGSLRFLFLDEANRLSHDNLGVLFDLCQTLELQLLIAAPEVARAEGNTTYRLVRLATPDGREEVRVSGRRTRSEA